MQWTDEMHVKKNLMMMSLLRKQLHLYLPPSRLRSPSGKERMRIMAM